MKKREDINGRVSCFVGPVGNFRREMRLFWGGMMVERMFSGAGNAEELKMLIFCTHSCEPSTKVKASLTASLLPWFFFSGPWQLVTSIPP